MPSLWGFLFVFYFYTGLNLCIRMKDFSDKWDCRWHVPRFTKTNGFTVCIFDGRLLLKFPP